MPATPVSAEQLPKSLQGARKGLRIEHGGWQVVAARVKGRCRISVTPPKRAAYTFDDGPCHQPSLLAAGPQVYLMERFVVGADGAFDDLASFWRLGESSVAPVPSLLVHRRGGPNHIANNLPIWDLHRELTFAASAGWVDIRSRSSRTHSSFPGLTVRFREAWRLRGADLESRTTSTSSHTIGKQEAAGLFKRQIAEHYRRLRRLEEDMLAPEYHYDEFAARFAFLAALRPDFAPAHYNEACMLARRGKLDVAMERLTRAIELDPTYRKKARRDSDLAELRGKPAFDRLVR